MGLLILERFFFSAHQVFGGSCLKLPNRGFSEQNGVHLYRSARQTFIHSMLTSC